MNTCPRTGITCLAALVFAILPRTPMAAADQETPAVERHAEAVRDWRARRDARLRAEDGWLTLVGLDWLDEGANTVGSGPDNDIRLPGGPEVWGTVYLSGGAIRFERAPGAAVKVNGKPADSVALVPDDEGEPTVVRSGDLSFRVLHRGSYALRVQDRNAPARVNFRGIDNFEVRHDWRIDARPSRGPPSRSATCSAR